MTNTGKSTLLVVDDTPENIDVLRGILGAEYSVKVANNGPLALKIAFSHPPDLIMLDIMMPSMDGYEVCRRLKEVETTRHIPVIFVTALADIEDEAQGFELGAADYIIKPVSPPIVRARVRSHLDLSDQRRFLEHLVAERTSKLERSNRQLEKTHLVMLEQLGRAADYRDNETGKHVLRVGNFSRLLALASGLAEPQAEMLMYASMMHDIGKIGVPDHILLKPGNLTVEEFEVVKKHPEIGAVIIGDHDGEVMKTAKDVALGHHEKWNGQGYPYGLSGVDIPIAARIVAIVDVFDALTSLRPYKEAWPVEKALALIAQEGGKHFDPELVRLFVGLEIQIRDIVTEYGDSPEELEKKYSEKKS